MNPIVPSNGIVEEESIPLEDIDGGGEINIIFCTHTIIQGNYCCIRSVSKITHNINK